MALKLRGVSVVAIFLAFFASAVMGLVLIDLYVQSFSVGKLHYHAASVPAKNAALVFGCSKYFNGRDNLYYLYRLQAVAQLWKAGKINAVLVSGDNSRKDYDEPTLMKNDLVSMGVPEKFIAVDYAGFCTLDSVIRAEKIFGLKDYIVVSQPFHCQRAIYLAQAGGQSVTGFCARDVAGTSGRKVRFREIFARLKAVLEICVAKNPKYLGPREHVNYRFELVVQK